MYKVIMGYGLPGSGKTTFLKKDYDSNSVQYRGPHFYINCDSLMKDAERYHISFDKHLTEKIASICYRKEKTPRYVYIDGLFTTNNDLIKIIQILKENVKDEFDIKIHWWEEDRESCLWNDAYRRNENCILSIKNLPFEKPNKKILEQTGLGISLKRHLVIRKSAIAHIVDDTGIRAVNGIIKSDDWTTGGTYNDCWGNSGRYYADEPAEFLAFDSFLEKLVPEISFLKYKKLWNEFVKVESSSESDYYSGVRYYSYYYCNIEDVVKKLIEWGLVKEN